VGADLLDLAILDSVRHRVNVGAERYTERFTDAKSDHLS
jgi:hypothetical protein